MPQPSLQPHGYPTPSLRLSGYARGAWVALLLSSTLCWLPPRLAADGKALFMKHCASCHGPDGRARTPIARKLGVKDLAESQLEEADIERQIVEGARDPQGNLRMPPFKEKTTAEELKLLIAHVKSLRKN